MRKNILFLLLFLTSLNVFAQKFEGLALTPQMGWNSWNKFGTDINEQMVKEMADALVSTGLRDAGYNHILLDDGWMEMERDAKAIWFLIGRNFRMALKSLQTTYIPRD